MMVSNNATTTVTTIFPIELIDMLFRCSKLPSAVAKVEQLNLNVGQCVNLNATVFVDRNP